MRRPASPPSADPAPALIRIERVGADGDGVGFLGGERVFVPFALPGEVVRACVAGQRGTLEAIVDASGARAEPPCPHFGACGGCALQHWRDAEYVGWKSAEVEAALRRAGFVDIPRPAVVRTPPHARRCIDWALRRAYGRVRVGLHRSRSAEIIDCETCVVLHPALLALLAPLRDCLQSLALLRREGSAIVNLLDTGPDLLLRTDAEPSASDRAALAAWARSHDIARVHWAKGNGVAEPVCVLRQPRATFAGVSVTPPPGGFMQASAEGEQAIVDAVRAGLPPGRGKRLRIIELFAGCGAITFGLAAETRVTAYEGAPEAVAAFREAINRAGLAGMVEAVRRDLARQPLAAAELARADAVVLDPPHAGAPAQMGAIAAARPERVIYVSCNPAALARDAAALQGGGYALRQVTLVDQFLWSARIESVCVFALQRPERASRR